MTGALRLVRIEARRSAGLLLFLPMVAVAVFVALGQLPPLLLLWPDTSFAIRNSIMLLGPIAAGVATWMAGRDRRRGMGEILASTPRPATLRTLMTWGGVALWCASAYLMVILVLFGITLREATYGGPYPSIVAVGLLAVVAHTALGFAAGRLLLSRFTAPAVVVALFMAQIAPMYADGSFKHLSPIYDYVQGDVFYGLLQAPSLWQTLWLLGLSGLALSAVALRSQRSTAALGAFALSLGLAATGGAALLKTPVDYDWNNATLIPYEPVCQDGPVTVCVHPAYVPVLPEVARLVNQLTEPLVGIPGAPTRAEQRSPWQYSTERNALPAGVVGFQLIDAPWAFEDLTRAFTLELTAIPFAKGNPRSMVMRSNPNAQLVVAEWLFERVWGDPCWEISPGHIACKGLGAAYHDETKPYYERFKALDPTTRRAWFETHYAALRAGTLTLEDLP